MRLTPWRQRDGFVARSPSSGYSTIRSTRRLCTQRNNLEAQLEPDGHTATLPVDHHLPWGEFRTAFNAHHLSAGLLHTKLKEFLDLEQGNHSVFD
jgi:hypothetical protein